MSVHNHEFLRSMPGSSETCCQHAETRSAANNVFLVKLRSDLQVTDVVSIVHYVTDFGVGDARGLALDGGWSIRLSELSDLRLLALQFPELIEGHSAELDLLKQLRAAYPAI